MDHNEMLFALQMRQYVITELEARFPESMSSLRRQEFINDNFEGYLIAALEEVCDTAKMIENIRVG